jgi:YHS domain-containing protein
VANAPDSLERVLDTSQVCMVNDQFMGRSQIPVEVDGNVYYGCCAMCEGRLARDPEVRFAIDPISNERVDKSVAVIGRDSSGSVLYFSSEENFAAYVERAGQALTP